MKTIAPQTRTSVRNPKSTRHARSAGNGDGNGNGHGSAQASGPAVSSKVGTWLAKPKHNLIGGRWVAAASGKSFEVFNPADGSVIAHVPDSDHEDINRAVAAARLAFESGPWRSMTPSERGKLVWRIGDLILEHADELAG